MLSQSPNGLSAQVSTKAGELHFGQPLAQARRQQQLLIAIAGDEVLCHAGMVLTAPDGPAPLRNSLREKRQLAG